VEPGGTYREPYISMRDIVKIYADGTIALRGVNLNIYRGEILGLLGENGAGKTTLMKILSGFIRPTRGHIYIQGREIRFRNPSDAMSKGIYMVHQHFSLVPAFTVLENICLLARRGLRSSLKIIDYGYVRERVQKIMGSLRLEVPLDIPVESLPVGLRQRAEILKALFAGADLLILDEPTSLLTPYEARELFRFIRDLSSKNTSVIFITHRMREALEVTDRIVVLRRGTIAGEMMTREATPERLSEMMVGRDIATHQEQALKRAGDIDRKPILEIRDLVVHSDIGRPAVKGVSIEVYRGEILGIAGVEGNGQEELVDAIVGLRRISGGSIMLDGVEIANRSPREIYRLGVAYIPSDRDRLALALNMRLYENMLIGLQRDRRYLDRVPGVIRWSTVKKKSWELIRVFSIAARDPYSIVKTLSGGNRQRVVLARELSKGVRLVIASNPTRGLDIALSSYVRSLLRDLSLRGVAVILVSSDLDEILELSDRIAVIFDGRIMGILSRDEARRVDIGVMMGGYQKT
jgi:simple sugar transport system ATP-binding protein